MINGWEEKCLIDVMQLQRGHDLPSQERKPGTIPIVGSFGITGWHNIAKVSGPGVAIGRSGGSFGVATYVASDYWPLNTCLYVTDFKGNIPRWVYWILHTLDFNSYNSGSAQPSLNRNFLSGIPILVPLIPDQQKIVDTLDSLDELIHANSTLVTLLSTLSDAIWKKTQSKIHKQLNLSSVANVVLGGTPSRSQPEYWGGEVPWINSGKANEFRILEPSEMITKAGLQFSSTKMMPRGSTIVAITGATLGQVSRLEIEACGNQSVIGVYSSDLAMNDYLFHFIKDRVDVLVQSATGGAQQHINKENVEQLSVGLLTDRELQEWHLIAAPLLTSIADALFENQRLRRIRDELLPLLLAGAITVREIAA